MATLVLSAVGTIFGGPIGGAIGALVGRQVDSRIFGTGSREGPRLKDLSLTTSSYGQPIAMHFGRMRSPGTIIWATDLVESRETSGGGKGKPKTTSYSYSVSFAVALASRPIAGLGRIWADGNLLRGAGGDLKAGGTLRLYTGSGSQPTDPLIASARGAQCPAFRNCAYVVFEDLQLADFGNRIPALTFEVLADDGPISLAEMISVAGIACNASGEFPELAGYSIDGGDLASHVEALAAVYPIASDAGAEAWTLSLANSPATPVLLPEAAGPWDDPEFGRESGERRQREASGALAPNALRYYDTARDYLPSLQRAAGRAPEGYVRTVDFPAALAADDARRLANRAAQRGNGRRETLTWRLAELDPAIAQGTVVKVPGRPGTWQVASWEWRERGVELQLERRSPGAEPATMGDPGEAALANDLVLAPTVLQAFELPWDGRGSTSTAALFAAASSSGAGWKGAALFLDSAGELVPLGPAGRSRATIGQTLEALPGGSVTRLDRHASLELELVSPDLDLQPAGLAALANGANRLLVGDEVLQFAEAEPLTGGRWRIHGLLRGRGGTEGEGLRGHPAGSSVVLLDANLTSLDPEAIPAGPATIVAIGQGDTAPVAGPIARRGSSLRPLAPVHPRVGPTPGGGIMLGWTRRARGTWQWLDEVEPPLVEGTENYQVGLGDPASPTLLWQTATPSLLIDATTLAELCATYAGAPLWVRQVGDFGLSPSLLLWTLP